MDADSNVAMMRWQFQKTKQNLNSQKCILLTNQNHPNNNSSLVKTNGRQLLKKSQSLDHNSLEFRIEIRVALFCCTSASLKFLCESVLLLAFSALFFTISCLEKKLLTFKFHNLHLVSHQSPCNLIIFGSYHYEKNKALEMMMIIDCVYKLTL